MSDGPYKWPLSIQVELPEDYSGSGPFKKRLTDLASFGFSGVELNVANPETCDLKSIAAFLGGYGLRMTMFASGLTAKTHGLSLSSANQEVRAKSIAVCLAVVERLAGSGAGVIIGYMKGPAGGDREGAQTRFKDATARIGPAARRYKVPLLVEATNRYESDVAHSLAEAEACIAGADNPYLQILPDTFHMNIEEIDIAAALGRHMSRFSSLHISDNNRYFPGLGAIDFGSLFDTLTAMGYRGGLAIEGNLQHSFARDLRTSMAYLAPLLKK